MPRYSSIAVPLSVLICVAVASCFLYPIYRGANPSNTRRRPPDATQAEILRKRIGNERLKATPYGYFVPDAILGDLLTPDIVRAVIDEADVGPGERVEIVDFILNHARKMFCILVWLRQVGRIVEFLDRKDTELPFSHGVAGGEFCDTQWEYLSPMFDRVYRELQGDTILPFRSQERIGGGGFGTVFKVEVYHVHQKGLGDFPEQTGTQTLEPGVQGEPSFGGVRNQNVVVVARKEIKVDEEIEAAKESFDIELETLEQLGKLEHPHIIDLLGAYSHAGAHSLIFPCAEMDLYQFMKCPERHPDFLDDSKFYNSIIGLSHALCSIHNYTRLSQDGKSTVSGIGYHHDIKPRNILVKSGKFLLADFGLSRVKLNPDEHSKTKHHSGTLSYGAPECLDKVTSLVLDVGRSIDIWSFGCVLCEVATYMVFGLNGVLDLKKDRADDQYSDDSFHWAGALKPQVETWIGKLEGQADSGSPMHYLISCIRKMLEPDVEKRLNAEQVLAYLQGHPSLQTSIEPLRLKQSEASDKTDIQTKLKHAVASQAEPVVRLLWEDGADPNIQNENEQTVLDQAANKGDGFMVELLLEKGVGVDASEATLSSALRHAAMEGKDGVGHLLLEGGADPTDMDKDGRTALDLADLRGHDKVSELLRKAEDEFIGQLILEKGVGTVLNDGASQGKKSVVRWILKKGLDLDTTTLSSALRHAASNGEDVIVRLLLAEGADPGGRDERGQTALHCASFVGDDDVAEGRYQVVEALLDQGVDIEAKDERGRTALHLAAENGHHEVVEVLLDGGADTEAKANLVMDGPEDEEKAERVALHFAAEKGHLKVVQLLLGRGANKEAGDLFRRTALHLAAESGHHEVVQLLLDQGADMEAETNYQRSQQNVERPGVTALYLAVASGHRGAVQVLVDQGAKMEWEEDTKFGGKCTALHLAGGNGDGEMVQLLLDQGADVEAKDSSGDTALHLSAMRGHKEIVQLLLDEGADIEGKGQSEWTALHSSASNGHVEIVRLLLDRGVDIEAKDQDGQTALHSSARGGHNETVMLLLDRGAEIGAKNKRGQTALHSAALSGHMETVQLLLDRGADIEGKDQDGWTVLHSSLGNIPYLSQRHYNT